MLPDRTSFRTTLARALRQALPWVLALAVATCTDDQNGPTRGGTGYFAFRPVYGISGSLSQFGIVADSVHIRLTRPVNQLVLDTTVFFPADSSQLRLALPVALETSPETLTAVIGISSGATLLFTDSLDVSVVDGPPSVANIPTVLLAYVGPGKNVAAVTLVPGDTTIVLKDTLFFGATAVDSSAAPVASFFVGWKTSDTTVAKINGAGRLIAPNLRGSVKVIATTPTGIADTTTVIFAPVPVILTADSGLAQTGFAGDSLAALFVGTVKGSDSLGIAGIGVRFTAVTAGGAIRDTVTLVTDVNGRVRTRGLLGTVAGPYTYTATVVGTALTRSFGATATAAAPSAIAFLSGDLQSDSAGRALAAPFVAKVTDAFGNVVSGAKVYWTRAAGHGTLSADSTITNASGLTSITYTLGAVGSDTVVATLAGTSAVVQFRATTINGVSATAAKVFGDSQTSVVGQLLTDSLAVVVKSATNFPVVGAPVIWTVLRGSAVAPDTVLTDVNGRAAVRYTLGTASGTDSVRAQAGPIAAVFTATAQAAAPSAIALLSGNAQTDTANRALPQSLVVAVTDLYGNPVLNTPVTFTRIAGHGHVGADTVTSAADNHPGTAYTFGTIPGLDSIRATLLANGASVAFAETSVNATPASVIQTHGGGISTVVGTPFADSLIVQILDVNDAPIALEKVIWTVTSGSGAVTLDTVLTDSLGFAVQHVTAGSTAGVLVVNAKVITPISPVNFALNTSAGAATAIAIVSGDAQTDTTGRLLPLPFVVHVADAFGNAVAGAKVGWTTVSGSGAPVTDTTLSDAAGDASTTYTLGAIAGIDTIRAGLFGTSAFVKFTGTTVSAAATSIVKLLGDAQVDTVLSTLTDSLVVSLRDGGNNPVANTWLYWTTAGVTLSADSTKTDLNGRAAVRATFGAVATTFPVLVRNVDTTVATVFTLTAHAGVATQITKIQGNAQTGPVSTPLPIDFGVLVQDAHGNLALPGTSVTWTNLAGFTPAGLPDTTATDSTGIAKLVAPLPGPVAGADSLIARILGGTAADTFTVTATSGAAAHLVYVSGTGQTDTVSALLAAPLVVQARDAATNPVAGAWVHFTRVAGTGTVLTDSVQTDAAGAAQTLYSMGPFIGRDSIVATVNGLADTVPFYNVSTPGKPKTLTKISGDSQSVGVSSALPAPFVVKIADQFGNPIQGPSVAFDTVGTGATILGTPVATDAAGLATTGTVTLGATAGTITFAATTSSLPGDTVFFTAVALPIGTSKQWLGTLSANWGTAGNWSPAVIPSSSDNVFIPAAAINQPVLDLARTIGGLQVESGASLALGSFNLTVQGNAQIDGTMSRTSGLTILSAAAGTARGNLAGVRVTGNITLAGPTTVTDSLQLTSGSLVVGGQHLVIAGAFSNNGSGAFTMQNAADSVTVTGATLFNGSASAGLLTAGTLVFQGPFSEPSGAAVFQGSGTHTTVFNGGTNQTVTFASASLAGNRFGNVVFANASGITLGGNLAVAGNTSVTSGVVTGLGRTAFLGGDLSDPTSLGWDVATTSLAGTPALLPDTILGNLDLTGTVTLAKPLVVKGNFTPNASSVLAFGGFGMRVDGGMTVSGAAQVKMQAAGDSLDVAGPVSWNGSTTAGLLTAGTFVVRGAFSEPSGSAVFQGSGSHKTVFAGSAPQAVSFGSAAIAGNRFGDVEFANAAGVQLTSNAAAAGNGAVTAGAVTGSLATTSITIGGNVVDPTSTSWQVPVTVLAGTPATLPDSFPAGVTMTGTVTLAKPLVIKGAFNGTGGALTLNGFRLRVDSTFTTISGAQVLMHAATDTLDIAGTVSWNGSTAAGQLTAGTAIFRGNFSEPSGSTEYQATGTHTTVFAGTTAQTVTFGAQGLAGNHFQDLVVANAAGVNFANGGAVAGNATIAGGVVTSSANQVLTVNGDLTDATNTSWRPEITSLTGTPSILPDSFTRNVTVSGNVQLTHSIAFKANLTGTAGVIIPAGFHIRVDSGFTLNGGAQFKMQNGTDTLDVAGATSWNGSTTTGLLTAGTIIFRGDFSEPSGSTVFSATGTHVTVFAGSAAQSVSFGAQGLAGNHFQDLVIANAAGVNFANGGAVAGNAVIAGGVITSSANQTLTLNGDLTDATNVSWRPEITSFTGTPSIVPDSFARNVTVSGSLNLGHSIAFKANLTATAGVIAPSGFHIRVDSGFTLSGSAQFRMQNGADTLDVAGPTSWNGSTTAGLLTAGTLILRGDFSEPSGATVFSATGTHVTVFAGTAAQSVTFGAQSLAGNHFQDLVVTNASGVNFANGGSVAGNASVVGGVVTSSANQVMTLNGDLTDASNVSWRPEITSLTGTPAALPDSFVRNVTASGTVTLPHSVAVQAKLSQTAGTITVNGFKLRVDSALSLTGGAFQMQNGADSVIVGGTATWNGSTAAGLLTAGTLVLRGDFSEPTGSAVFQPTGTHTTVFKDSVTHTVTFAAPGATTNRFNDLRLEGPTALALGNNLVVNGAMAAPLGLPVTIGSTAGLRSVATRGLSINTVTFDSVRVGYSGAPINFLHNVTFQHQDPTTVQFAIAEAGSATPEQLQNVQFLTTPTTGKYVSATDTLANGSPLIVQMFHSFPLDGTPFEQQVGGGDGATIDWSAFKFLIQPLDAGVLGVLDTVQVQVKGPDGNSDANFTGNVTLALGANPGTATLGGTTTVAAVLGVAKFGDLTLSAAGFGYTLVATTAGIAPDTSSLFNITVPLPVGFTNQWFGTTSTDWNTASNWSAGTVPDTTTNVFISGVGANAPSVQSGTAGVNRLRVATGATLTIATGDSLIADSTVEAGTAITGPGTLVLRKTGTITGQVSSVASVVGSYHVAGTASFGFNLDIQGDLLVGPDTLLVTGLLQTSGNGRLGMSDPNALVAVTGPAQFFGGPTDSLLTDGVLRISGDLSSGGVGLGGFAPSGNHLTVLNGSGTQHVLLLAPPPGPPAETQGPPPAYPVQPSHFARLQVSTAGTAEMDGPSGALGDVVVAPGATLADTVLGGFMAHGGLTVNTGGTFSSTALASGGPLNVDVGGTYSSPLTVLFGIGAPLTVAALPYDTLIIQRLAVAGTDLVIPGDLRIDGTFDSTSFDLGGHSVTVGGSFATEAGGMLVMQNAADLADIAHDVTFQGGSECGLLTDGTLRIAGNFQQLPSFSPGVFCGSGNHLTQFIGGASGLHHIAFASPSNDPTDTVGSHFGRLDLAAGVDSISGRVPAQSVSIGGSVTMDTAGFGNNLASYGNVTILGTSDSVHLQALQLFGALTKAGSGTYHVGVTAYLGGGGTLPHLPYTDLSIVNATYSLGDSQTVAGNITLGEAAGEVGPPAQPGELIANGFGLFAGGTLSTNGLGLFSMAAGDSVDVGAADFRGGNSTGHFTGGKLVVRGAFNAQGSTPFMADAAHTTILASAAQATLYTSSDSSRFGKLVVLDALPRSLGGGGFDLEVLDSLIIGSSTSGITDTIGFGSTPVRVHGPVFTVAGSGIALRGTLEADSTLAVAGSYSADTTVFGGHNILIPTLPYTNVTVTGTAALTDSLILPPGSEIVVAGSGDLTLAGHRLRGDRFQTKDLATLTMTNAADTVDMSSLMSFDGGNETGKISAGVFLVHGAFNQGAATSDSTFVATGTNEVRFTDTATTVSTGLVSMGAGASRFNNVTITGAGVAFTGAVWIGGNVGIVSPTVNPVTGTKATIFGTLGDAGPITHAWDLDTTVFLANVAVMPDSIGGGAIFENGFTPSDSVRIGGFARNNKGAFSPNGHTVRVHGALDIAGSGVLAMLGPQDSLFVDSTVTIAGGTNGSSNLTAGDLQIGGSLVVSVPAGFWASGTHRTYLYGPGTRVVDFGTPGNVFHNFAYSDGTELTTDIAVQGKLTGPGETPGVLYGVDSLLTIGDTTQQGVVFNNVRVAVGQTNPLFDVSFQGMNPARTQVTVTGAGRPAPVDLSVIRFATLPTTGKFVDAVDTLADGDSLVVRMNGSTPLQGTAFSGGTGEGAVRWGKLVFTTLPVTVDSLTPFVVVVAAQGPDGQNYNQNTLDIALASDTAGDVLGGTLSQGFSFGMATFADLMLTKPASGVTFKVAVQHGVNDSTVALDTATSTPLTVFNPVPLGAIIWDGSAGNNLWSDTTNWSTGTSPSAGDSVFIPGGQTVTFNTVTTLGGLVLGQGASLDLQGNLTVTGRVAAGNTITSSGGSLLLTGSLMPVSGTLPNTVISGTVNAAGHIAVNGNLTIDGPAAEFNVAGQRVDISNSLITSNGGLLTMDGADTVYTSDATFGGGDETNRLIAGLLVIQGSGLTETGGDPRAFRTGGTFTTIFGNFGDNSNGLLTDPDSSNFNNVWIENPAGTSLSGNTGTVQILGDLNVEAGGVVTGPSPVHVHGFVASYAANDSFALTTLQVDGGMNVNGGYNVGSTEYTGTGQVVQALPYQGLSLNGGGATLGANVTAINVGVTDPTFALGGHTLRTGFLNVSDTGTIAMTDARDTLIVDTVATIQGGDETGRLTAGAIEILGDLNLGIGNYRAARTHTIRFLGGLTHHVSASFPVEIGPGPGVDLSNHLGTVEVFGDSVVVTDHGHFGLTMSGDLQLTGATWVDSTLGLLVHGAIAADVGGVLDAQTLGVDSTLAMTTPANYRVRLTRFVGAAQTIPVLPYPQMQVEGNATLDSAISTSYLSVIHLGHLTLGGHALTVDTTFTIADTGHLVMHDPADTLEVGGHANFFGDDATGDLTEGMIRAENLVQAPGTSGSDNGFVQTGNAQLAPQAGDIIQMNPTGPTGSRIGFLNLSHAGGPVYIENAWVADSMVNTDPTASAQTFGPTSNLVVMGNVKFTAGSLALDTLAVGGTIAFDSTSGSYGVTLTKFVGSGQVVPIDVPYANVQVDQTATLGGDLNRPATNVAVLNSGDLDLGGHTLAVNTFQTNGQGVLTMTHPADVLYAPSIVIMNGGNTVGHLTAGVIQTSDFEQFSLNDDSSYAPSGTHAMELIDGPVSESGPRIQTSTAAFNILRIVGTGTGPFDKPKLVNNVTVRDTFEVTGNLDAQFNNVDAFAAVFGPASNTSLSQLTVHDTLIVAPTAVYNVGGTVFAAGAKTIPAGMPFASVAIEGAQTLADTLPAFNIVVRQGGVLTPNGHKVTTVSSFGVQDNAHLVMATGDTLEVGTASFDGAASTTDLAGGVLRIRDGLSSGSSTNGQTFVPTGMVTEFYGGGTANVAFSSAPQSFINDLRVIGGTTIAPTTYFLVMGPAVFKDGSKFDGNSAPAALDFRGKVAVLDTSAVVSVNTVFFADSLTMATPSFYSVALTRFDGTAGIPDLPYQGLIIDSLQTTLTHQIAASGQLQIIGGTPGVTKITLGGHPIRAGTLDISGYARVEMHDPNDTLESSGTITFAGEDESGLLTAGHLRVGGDLHQNGFYSSTNLRTDGVRVEFYGPSNHLLTFDNPDTSLSYIGNVDIQGGGKLYTSTASVFKGRVDVGTSATLDLGFLTSANSDFFGPVTVASGGKINNSNLGDVVFHDTLLVDPAASYTVVNTRFREIDTIPNLSYQNLYLSDGTNIALAENISTGGVLSLESSTPGGQQLTLNGHSVNVGGNLITQNFGVVTLTNPADLLSVAGDANFWGGDEAGHLTAGAIVVSKDFSQQAAHAVRSFRSTGTTVLFPFSGPPHEVTFATADSSFFADVSAPLTDQLLLHINGRMKATGTVGNYVTSMTGDSLEAGVLSAGPGGGIAILTWLKAGSIAGNFLPFNVGTTELAGSGVLPILGYDSLIVSGAYTIPSFGGSIVGPLTIASGGSLTGTNSAATLAVTKDVVVNGGLLDLNGDIVTVGGNFATQNGGLLNSTAPASDLNVLGNASFLGGSETSRLTVGLLEIHGGLTSGIGTRFTADSLYLVNFTGGGDHDLALGDPTQQSFGTLQVTGSGTPDSDTLTIAGAGDINTYRLAVTGNARVIGSAQQIVTQQLAVDGATFQQVLVHENTTSDQPMQFDNVAFTGFSSTDIQLFIEHPGTGILNPTQFINVDFDDAANPDGTTGFFVLAQDTDGIATFLNLQIFGPDSGIGATLTKLLSGALVSWFPPT